MTGKFKISTGADIVFKLLMMSLAIYLFVYPFILFPSLSELLPLEKGYRVFSWITGIISCVPAILIFILFQKIKKQQTWKPEFSRLIKLVALFTVVATYLLRLSRQINTDYVAPAKFPYLEVTSLLTSSNMLKTAFINFMGDVIPLTLVLCLLLLADFLNFTYSIKKENESFI